MSGQTTLAFPRDFAARLEQLKQLQQARATATAGAPASATASDAPDFAPRSATQAAHRGVPVTVAGTQDSLIGANTSREQLVCVSILITPSLLPLGEDSGPSLPLKADTETNTSVRSGTKGAALSCTATWPSADTAVSPFCATRGAGPSRVVLGAAEVYAAFSRQGAALRALDLTGWAMDLSKDGEEVIFENPLGTGASGSSSTGLAARFHLGLGTPAVGGAASSYLRAVKMPVATAEALFAGAGTGTTITGVNRDQVGVSVSISDEQDKAKAAFDGLMSTSSTAVPTGGSEGLVEAIPGMVSGGLESIQLVFATMRTARKLSDLQHVGDSGAADEDEDFPLMDGVLFE